MENNQNQQDLNIELPDEIATGVFSNLALINHSPTEFVLDFIQMMPGVQKPKVRSRVILTPEHAKRLLNALSENLKNFESQFGNVKDDDTFHLNFGQNGQA
ncbi:DUF3467 domain-containing protein [Apibacter muscae]|uniref:DUF3467 domain-containing protein n=1 Tax=Apibacter muscae TaxID=2509004 RepID=A0A563DC97_9FLAO|nr:DUF3467 domain-containing protein [Apibacter muscae]TWP23954.1 DUF3467 domain-containing protein [Apibacter muscae]TWP27845.1 DUF3467 domain-containing protein [Apibacter muscae]TWP29666.1 DUF3467 domain-containing protein [Apibacter muscae]